MEDGSIVQAENTQFKAHRSLLSRASPIYTALLRRGVTHKDINLDSFGPQSSFAPAPLHSDHNPYVWGTSGRQCQPAKRARKTDPGGMSLIRSNIWLGDGNIVIQADGVQFKVHQGYLARLSTIFSDVFSMPQPTDGAQPQVDGCHILHLQDSVQDLAIVLFRNIRSVSPDVIWS
jgi:hypothetical protein